jgi:hypothetical protein
MYLANWAFMGNTALSSMQDVISSAKEGAGEIGPQNLGKCCNGRWGKVIEINEME